MRRRKPQSRSLRRRRSRRSLPRRLPRHAASVTPTPPSAETQPAAALDLVATQDIYYRVGPGDDQSYGGRLVKGQRVRVLGRSGDWYRFRLADGSLGYVPVRALEALPGEPGVPPLPAAPAARPNGTRPAPGAATADSARVAG